MNSNREFAEPPKPGFFKKYGWYIIPIALVVCAFAPQIKQVELNGLEKLVIMTAPDSPEDDTFVPDDSVFEINGYDEPQMKVARKGGTSDVQDVDEYDGDEFDLDIIEKEVDGGVVSDERELSTLELLERQNHESIVRQAKREGVSTEGSDVEILEHINRKSIIEQAKREGVSTEGSDVEILERINRKSIIEQAKREGVSTEGSDVEILERINHKSIVEQAKRAGVSTKGTDVEILERINRKSLEKYN